MKKQLTNNIGLKLLALVIAFIIWLVVVNISNPEVRGNKTVGLETVNEDVITRVGKTFEINGSSNITVSYSVRTRDAYKIKASDFRAYIDLNDLYDVTGSVPVTVEVVNNKDIFLDTPTARPAVVRLTVENMVRRSVSIVPFMEGDPAEGYSVGKVDVDPGTVQITGPQSIVDRISYAEVYVNTEGLDEDTAGNESLSFYDSDGNQIKLTDSRITLNHDRVDYHVTMLNGKSVPVSYETTGEPSDGYRMISVEPSLASVIVMGRDADLEQLTEIRIPAERMNITGAVSTMTFVIDINEYLPEQFSIVGDHESQVTVRVEPLNIRSFTYSFDEIGKTNPAPDRTYAMEPGQITLVLTGLAEDLTGVDRSMLNVSVDLSNMGVGVHTGHINCTLPEGCTLKSSTPFQIHVGEIIEESPEATPSESSITEETGEAASEEEEGEEDLPEEEEPEESGEEETEAADVTEKSKETREHKA